MSEESDKGMEKAMASNYTKEGIFIHHNCGGCQTGKLPCREGDSRNCSWPRARND